MKKTFLIPTLIAGLLLTACDDIPSDMPGSKYDDLPYSALTPEEQKERLANEAYDILNKVRGLQTAQATNLMQSFFLCMKAHNSQNEPSYNNMSEPKPWASTLHLATAQMRTAFYDKDMVAVSDVYGTFTWDAVAGKFIFEEAPTDQLLIVLPARPYSTLNNGLIKITGHGSGQWYEVDRCRYEIPDQISVSMQVDNVQVACINTQAQGIHWNYGDANHLDPEDVDWGDIANSVTINVQVDDYVITTNATVDGNNVSSNFSFTKSSEVIIAATVGGTMDWSYQGEYCTYSSLDENGHYVCHEWDYSVYPIPENATLAELRIGNNLVAEGFIEIKALMEETDDIQERYKDNDGDNWSEREERAKAERLAAACNNHMKATLVSLEDNAKIATLKWDINSWEDTWWEYDNNGNHTEVIRTRHKAAPFLVFNDNEEVLAEAYFGEGFQWVIKEWEDFFMSFEVE